MPLFAENTSPNNFFSVCFFAVVWAVASVSATHAQPVYTYMDMQIHTTMHFPYPFFGVGLEYFSPAQPPPLSYQHQFTNVNYANYLQDNAGMRIIINGAITTEFIESPEKARETIVEQINYVNQFAASHSDKFVVARTPEEVRKYFFETDKTIILHSIEGGKQLIRNQEDANFWASQGVVFITLIHLTDSEFGGAAILPGLPTRIINIQAKKKLNKEMGLTEMGKQAIVWLANAGIMTDVTHMNDKTRKEALAWMEFMHIPPISTHEGFKPIQNHPRALTPENIISIYSNHGFISLPVSGTSLEPYHPISPYKENIQRLPHYCNGSVDSYILTYLAVKEFIETTPSLGYETHTEEKNKINYAIGFQTDFNGWLNHSKPRYGEDGCFAVHPDSVYEPIEIWGLAHPGLMESQWRLMEKENVDLLPVKRASEKFLQLWEFFIQHKNTYTIKAE